MAIDLATDEPAKSEFQSMCEFSLIPKNNLLQLTCSYSKPINDIVDVEACLNMKSEMKAKRNLIDWEKEAAKWKEKRSLRIRIRKSIFFKMIFQKNLDIFWVKFSVELKPDSDTEESWKITVRVLNYYNYTYK